jgi:hypothetical protein
VDLREIHCTTGWTRLRIMSTVNAEPFGLSNIELLESAIRKVARQADIDSQ